MEPQTYATVCIISQNYIIINVLRISNLLLFEKENKNNLWFKTKHTTYPRPPRSYRLPSSCDLVKVELAGSL
jgi:hypothetical protein